MKKLIAIKLFILSLFALQAFAQAPAVAFTEKDREFALKYLNETKADYITQLIGLSDAQLNFRAAEGRWTIAEIAEHITVVEQILFEWTTVGQFKPSSSKCENPFRIDDRMLMGAITNRAKRFTAPEPVVPNGRWKTKETLIASFEKARTVTTDFIKNNKTDLRSVFGPSPLGTVDGFQQILFITGHSERHLAQLKEVKADKNYPKK